MFIKQIASRVIFYNDNMVAVNEFKDAIIEKENDRIKIVSRTDSKILCDMPLENTFILY